MKVIFKRLEDIPLESRRKMPTLVGSMEHLFDGITVRKLYEGDGIYYKYGGGIRWTIALRWTKSPHDFSDIEELFEI